MSIINSSPEIFSDNIESPVRKEEKQKSLSKMKKPELYELCKKLVEENKKLQLFTNSSDELLQTYMKNEKELQIKINKLEYDNNLLDKQYFKLFNEHEELGKAFIDERNENNKLKSFLMKIRKTFIE